VVELGSDDIIHYTTGSKSVIVSEASENTILPTNPEATRLDTPDSGGTNNEDSFDLLMLQALEDTRVDRSSAGR
jgi:hypothetical protein